MEPNPQPSGDPNAQVSELHVKAHVMTLRAGLFCIYQTFTRPVDPQTGLPAVRIMPAFDDMSDNTVTVNMMPADTDHGTAALVKVTRPDAQIIITVYQQRGREETPQLQVLRLSGDLPVTNASISEESAAKGKSEVMAHIQRSGDVGCRIGEWLGKKGSQNWIEGFGLSPEGFNAEDIEYQAVLGKNWLSPWVTGGKFCGSRGMALPLLGLKVRLKNGAAEHYDCSYSATFVDGIEVGPISNGEVCEAGSLSALESFQLTIEPKSVVRLATKRTKRG